MLTVAGEWLKPRILADASHVGSRDFPKVPLESTGTLPVNVAVEFFLECNSSKIAERHVPAASGHMLLQLFSELFADSCYNIYIVAHQAFTNPIRG